MGKKVNHFNVFVEGKEVVIKRCTGCGKNKSLNDYSKGVALFDRQAKCKSCNKEEYAAKKAYWDGFKRETQEQIIKIRYIELNLPFLSYTGRTRREAEEFLNYFVCTGRR